MQSESMEQLRLDQDVIHENKLDTVRTIAAEVNGNLYMVIGRQESLQEEIYMRLFPRLNVPKQQLNKAKTKLKNANIKVSPPNEGTYTSYTLKEIAKLLKEGDKIHLRKTLEK